jgi:DNA-binding transcriptional regulator YbjK
MKKQRKAGDAGSSRRGRTPRPRGEKTLAMLQRALLTVIGRVGASGITHRRVADEAGVSLSATTYYFESKGDMIRKAYKFLCDGVLSDADRLIQNYDEPTSGAAALEGDVAATGEYLRSRLRANVVESLTLIELMLTAARDDEARRLLADDRSEIRKVMVGLMGRSGSSSPEEDADLVAAMINGLVLENLARGRPAEFEARAVVIVERVMRWLSAGESQ